MSPPGGDVRLTLRTCEIDLARRQVYREGATLKLTALEGALLAYLGARPGQTVDRQELLEQVWGYRPGVRSRAVDHAVRRLRAKIERDRAQPEHLVAAYGGGYRLELPVRIVTSEDFVGRTQALTALQDWWSQPGRLRVLAGPTGIGKTRLAEEWCSALRRRADSVPVWNCALRGADSHQEVLRRVAVGLGVSLGGAASDQARQLGRVLADRGPALLVLDDPGASLGATVRLATAWVDQAPDLRVLMTSQERPTDPRVSVQPVPALAVDEAVALFTLLARPSEDSDDVIAELVSRLDCLPLAVRLASARTGLQSPRRILALLDERFEGLAPDADGLDAALAWATSQLAPQEAELLGRLAVFRGGFGLDGLDAMLDATAAQDRASAVTRLEALVRRSLVQVWPGKVRRFSLLESVQAWASRHLIDDSTRDRVYARHTAWCLATAEAHVAVLHGRKGGEALDALERDQDNLRAVLARALPHDPAIAIRAGLCLDPIVARRGPASARLALWQDLAECADDAPLLLRVRALRLYGDALRACGRLQRDLPVLERALALALDLGEPAETAQVHIYLGVARLARGELPEAAALFTAAGEHIDPHQHPWTWFIAQANLGHAAWFEGRIDEAEERYLRALGVARATANDRGVALALGYVGNARLQTGDLDGAARAFTQALEAHTQVGDLQALAAARGNLGMVRLEQGQLTLAAELLGRAARQARRLGADRLEAVFLGNLAVGQLFQDQPGAALETVERALGLHQAVGADPRGEILLRGYRALCLVRCGRTDSGDGVLTRARQDAQGLTDPTIDVFLDLCEGLVAASRAGWPPLADPAAPQGGAVDVRLVRALRRRWSG